MLYNPYFLEMLSINTSRLTFKHFLHEPMDGTCREVLNGSPKTSVSVGVDPLSMLYV